MKSKYTRPAILAVAVPFATGPPTAMANGGLLGQDAAASSADYTMTIGPGTRCVNVTGGDTVTFVSGDNSFTWNFDEARTVTSFDLDAAAPQGMLDHRVRAYIAPNVTSYGG